MVAMQYQLEERGEDRSDRRQLAETVRRRLQYLAPAQRTLIELVLQRRTSRREMATVLGVPAGTLSRRIARIASKLHDPLVVALIERPGSLRPEYRQLALEHFLQQLSIRELADLHRMSPFQVQQALQFVQGWFRAQSGGRT